MAQYDGSIRINTEILVKSAEKQLRALENSMDKTATKAASLRDKMEAMRSTKIPTQEYAALDKELSNLGAQYDRIAERQQKFLEAGGKENSKTYKGMVHDLDMIDERQNSVISKMKELESAGKAFTPGSSTEEYAKIGQQVKYLEASLETMNQQHQIAEDRLNAALQRREAEREKLNQIAAEEQRLAQIRENTTVENQEIIDLLQRRREVLQEIADLEKADRGEGYQEYYDAQGELSDINQRIDAIRQERNEVDEARVSYKQWGEVAANALKRLCKSIYKYAVSPFISLGKIAAKTFLGIGKGAKSSNNILRKGFKNILKYGLGIRSVYILINKFRNAVKEGFRNLAQVSAPVNESLSMLKSSLTQLKNSFATAFAPILTTIAPALTTLINLLSQAATYVGMFIATLTGASSFTKAIAVQEDYAASLDKTGSAAKKAAGALAKFDDLDVLSKPTSSGGGAGAGQVPIADMFEEVPIPDRFKDMAQWIKDMWAGSDFTELGSFLGERLKESLDNIPWDSIQEKARNIGKSLATLINGAIETDGLGYMLGNTLAQGINTAFNFWDSFVHNLNWQGVGAFIAESLNGLFQNIDWNLIYDTFVTGAQGLGDAVNSFIDNFNWDNVSNTISNAINIIAETVYTFFATIDWEKLGKELGNQLKEAIEKTDWEQLGRAIGSVIQAALDFVTSFMGEQDFGEVAQAVVDFLKGAFDEVDMGQLAEVIMAALTIKLAAKATASVFKIAAGAILSALGTAISALTGAFSAIASIIIGGISSAIAAAGGIGNLLTADITALVTEGGAAAAGLTFGTAVIGGVMAAISGWKLGSYIAEEWLDLDTQPFLDTMADVKDSFTDGSWKEALKLWGDDIYDAFVLLGERQEEKFGEIKVNLSELWESMRRNALEIWENIKVGLSEKWETMKKTVTNIFTNMKESVSKIFDGMWGSIKGVINSILGGVEKMANGVVDAINTVIRALNGLSFEIPEFDVFGKKLGGTTIGFDISEIPNVNIPRLANGAVIRGGNPFMAILGDQPSGQVNVETPASLIKDMVVQGIAEAGIGNRGNVPVNINLQYDGETFARLSIPDILAELSRQGYNVDLLGYT